MPQPEPAAPAWTDPDAAIPSSVSDTSEPVTVSGTAAGSAAIVAIVVVTHRASPICAGTGSTRSIPHGVSSTPHTDHLAELDRQQAERARCDSAEQAWAAQILHRAGTEPLRGPVPAGVDPVAFHQARIGRYQRVIDEQEGVRGVRASNIRGDARRMLKQAQVQLTEAEAAAAAGQLDPRGPKQRLRERRAARARDNGARAERVNITDPDSRLMTEGAGGGSVQSYNAQVAVTDDHLILGVHVSQDANDLHCYTPTLDAATAQATALGKTIGLVLADAGYFTHDNLTAPGPDRLIAPGKNRDLAAQARDNPIHQPPPPDTDPRQAMRHRLRQPSNAERYKRRSATVEPVIAHLKDQTRLRRFARPGLPAATAELNLAAAAINLTRLHHTRAALT